MITNKNYLYLKNNLKIMGCLKFFGNAKKIKEKEVIIVPGLSNFEGNCYLNSILQCFYYCNDLTKYFINNGNYK